MGDVKPTPVTEDDPLGAPVEPGQAPAPEPDSGTGGTPQGQQPAATPPAEPTPAKPDGQQEPTPQKPGDSQDGEPTPSPEPPKTVSVEQFEELQTKLNEATEQLSKLTQPPPQMTPEQVAQQQAMQQQVTQENQLMEWATRYMNDQSFRDEQIAEHGKDKCDAYYMDARVIYSRRQLQADLQHQQQQGMEQQRQEQVQVAWENVKQVTETAAKNYGLDAKVLETDPMLKKYFALPEPDDMVKQAIEDRLFRLAQTKGVPPKSQPVVTAEQKAARDAANRSTTSSPAHPQVMDEGEKALQHIAELESNDDPIAAAKPL